MNSEVFILLIITASIVTFQTFVINDKYISFIDSLKSENWLKINSSFITLFYASVYLLSFQVEEIALKLFFILVFMLSLTVYVIGTSLGIRSKYA